MNPYIAFMFPLLLPLGLAILATAVDAKVTKCRLSSLNDEVSGSDIKLMHIQSNCDT